LATTGATQSSVCGDCAAGTFSATTGASSIIACGNCQIGKFSAAGASVCESCPAVKYNPDTGQSVCENCAAGKYLATTGATQSSACGDCQIGKFSVAGASVCDSCWDGKYNPDTGQSFCVNGAAGKFSATRGATNSSVCGDCAAGTFSATTGATNSLVCGNCATGKTSETGASECTTCGDVAAQYAAYQRMPDHLQTCFTWCNGYCRTPLSNPHPVCGTATVVNQGLQYYDRFRWKCHTLQKIIFPLSVATGSTRGEIDYFRTLIVRK